VVFDIEFERVLTKVDPDGFIGMAKTDGRVYIDVSSDVFKDVVDEGAVDGVKSPMGAKVDSTADDVSSCVV
jgi:hypothetical protein